MVSPRKRANSSSPPTTRRESSQDLTLAVPPTIDPNKLKIGDSYLATATVDEDGSLTLAGIASDERTRGADDASSAQGDLQR